ncbi:MAG TPA: hypothetical protein VMA30_21750 [Xanthobacteraceae bacterium]|nr:hypothetical protein [Xanthobacteraceae bacterium]
MVEAGGERTTPDDTDAAFVAAVAAVAPAAPIHAPAAERRAGRVLGAIVLAAVGVALAGVGVVETTTFAAKVGGLLFAALAVCADALVLLMPSAATVLWRRRSPAIVAAVALWLVGSAVTLSNLSGYIGSSDDHYRAGRQVESTERTLAMERLARLRHERASIAEMRPVTALSLAVRRARGWNKLVLEEALAVAQRRDELDAELRSVASSLSALPEVATVDPSASVLSDISGATVSESDMRQLRLALLLLLPLCGGFVLSIALNLLAGTGDTNLSRQSPTTRAGLDRDGRVNPAAADDGTKDAATGNEVLAYFSRKISQRNAGSRRSKSAARRSRVAPNPE